jgi:hypothetical protein
MVRSKKTKIMSFLTVARISPARADLTTPKIKFFVDTQILDVKIYPSTGRFIGGATLKYGSAGRPERKKVRVFESPSQILVAQNSTDINAQDKLTAQTAVGTNQGNAFAVTKYYTQFSTAASGTGAVLDASTKGKVRVIQNDGANTIVIYPASGEFISGNAVNVGVNLAPGQRAHFACYVAGTWVQAVMAAE